MQNHFNGVAGAAAANDPEPDWLVKKQKFTDIYKNLNGVKNVETTPTCNVTDNNKNNDEDKMENVNDTENELIMKSNNNNTKVLNNNNNNNEAINLSVSPKSASTYMSDDDGEINGNISDDSGNSDNNKKSKKNESSPSTALMYKLNHTKKHVNSKRIKEIELDDDCDMKNDIINANKSNSFNKSQLINKISYISQKDNTHDDHRGSSSEENNCAATTRNVNSSEDSVIDNHEQYNQHNNIINNNHHHHHSSKKGKFCVFLLCIFVLVVRLQRCIQ